MITYVIFASEDGMIVSKNANNTAGQRRTRERAKQDMARKETTTRADIVKAAFELTKEEGHGMLTARRLAGKIGCSTQPIFRVYKNMDELYSQVFDEIIQYFSEFYRDFPKMDDTPFVNLGLAYIKFAQVEPHLFEVLFLSKNRYGKSLYELLNGREGFLVQEINKAKAAGAQNPSELFMKMWIFIHGAACMVVTGDYDLEDAETLNLLKASYLAYFRS